MSFRVVMHCNMPEFYFITFREPSHQHGHGLYARDNYQGSQRLSAKCRAFIQQKTELPFLLEGQPIDAAAVLRLWRAEMEAHAADYGDLRKHRDYHLTKHDIVNIHRNKTECEWKLGSSEAASVFQWSLSSKLAGMVRFLQWQVLARKTPCEKCRTCKDCTQPAEWCATCRECALCQQITNGKCKVHRIGKCQCTQQCETCKKCKNCPTYDETSPFIMVIQSSWQRDCMRKFGDKMVFLDSTHGMFCLGYYFATLLVEDDHGTGIPVAWCIMSSESTNSYKTFLKAVWDDPESALPMPKSFMVDCAESERNAIKEVFPAEVKIFLCSWHVARAWYKNVITKVKSREDRYTLYKGLSTLLYSIKGQVNPNTNPSEIVTVVKNLLENFYVEWEGRQPAFITYVKKEWGKSFPHWAHAFRHADYGGHDTNNLLESYHRKLKSQWMWGQGRQRLDLVIYRLLIALKYMKDDQLVKDHGSYINRNLYKNEGAAAEVAKELLPTVVTHVDNACEGVCEVLSAATSNDKVKVTFRSLQDPLGCTCLTAHTGKVCCHFIASLLFHNVCTHENLDVLLRRRATFGVPRGKVFQVFVDELEFVKEEMSKYPTDQHDDGHVMDVSDMEPLPDEEGDRFPHEDDSLPAEPNDKELEVRLLNAFDGAMQSLTPWREAQALLQGVECLIPERALINRP
eukprot:jgi/Mesvir1/26584/Mv25704-RA.1